MANVAQLVEPRFVVPVVVGSSPIVRPIKKLLFVRSFFIEKGDENREGNVVSIYFFYK